MDSDSRLIKLAREEVDRVAPIEAFLPSSLVGYRVLSEIHRGTQGVVYEAIQESTGQAVAIKVMRQGPHASEADRFRFEREVRILGRLRHPNIVSIHDTGSSVGGSWFVMDYIRGEPLDVWSRSAARSIPEILRTFVKICDAVGAAHLRGVIHRDLKPGNIRMDERGEPHVLDFGLAKVDDDADGQPALMTMTGQFVGSLPWSAPEQAAGESSAVDVRTDVYALGVILYQLLCRRFPYAVTGNLRDILDNIQTSEPVRPRSVRSDVDDELETIVLTALAKTKERRYQTADELQRDLVAYLAGDPIQAKRDSGWYLFRKQLLRHRIAVGVAVGFGLLVTIGFLTCLTFWRQAEHHRVDAVAARHEAEAARAAAEQDASERRRVASFFSDEVFDSGNPYPMADIVGEVDIAPIDDQSLALVLQRAGERARERFADAPRLEAEVREALGRGFLGVRRYEDAADEFSFAFEVRRSEYGDDHPDSLDTALWLGEAFACAGDSAQAETILAPTVLRMERVFGPDENRTLSARQALGWSQASQGRIDEGVRTLVEIHELSREHKGGDDVLTITLAPSAAYWLTAAGRADEGEQIARQASVEARREFGPAHAVTQLTESALRRILDEGRAVRAAQDVFVTSTPPRDGQDLRFEMIVAHDGATPPEIGLLEDQTSWLGLIDGKPAQIAFGRGDASAPGALARLAPGAVHFSDIGGFPGDLASTWRRAEALLADGQRVSGMALLRAVLDGLTRHPDAAPQLAVRVRARLGQELADDPSTLVEGESLLRRAYAEAVTSGSPSDVDALVCRQELAVAVSRLGRIAEADALLDGVLTDARRALPEGDARLASLQWTQADALRRMGRDADARRVLTDAVDALATALGEDDATTRAARAVLDTWDTEARDR